MNVLNETGNPPLECFIDDFSSLSEVRQMATTIGQSHDHLDVVINNAGVYPIVSKTIPHPVGAQGHELGVTVNYLAPFLPIHLLLPPCLRKAASDRVVNLASAAQDEIDIHDLMTVNDSGSMRAYSRSEPAWTRENRRTDRPMVDVHYQLGYIIGFGHQRGPSALFLRFHDPLKNIPFERGLKTSSASTFHTASIRVYGDVERTISQTLNTIPGHTDTIIMTTRFNNPFASKRSMTIL